MKSNKNIGSLLREKRTQKDMPLEQIEFETKIPIKILHQIEENNFPKDLPEVYIKGYIRNYGKLVEIKSNILMALYKRDHEYAAYKRVRIKEKKSSKFTAQKAKELFLDFISLKKITILVISLLSLAISYFLVGFITTAFEKPALKLDTPFEITADYEGNFETTESSVTFSGITEADSTVSLGAVPISLNADYRFTTEPIPLESERTEVKIIAENTLGRTSTIEITVIKKDSTFEKIDFTLKVLEDTNKDVLIKLDGEKSVKEILKKGDILTLSAQNFLEIEAEEFDKLELIWNNTIYTLDSRTNLYRFNASRTDLLKEN